MLRYELGKAGAQLAPATSAERVPDLLENSTPIRCDMRRSDSDLRVRCSKVRTTRRCMLAPRYRRSLAVWVPFTRPRLLTWYFARESTACSATSTRLLIGLATLAVWTGRKKDLEIVALRSKSILTSSPEEARGGRALCLSSGPSARVTPTVCRMPSSDSRSGA
jgi:hypothetical protein